VRERLFVRSRVTIDVISTNYQLLQTIDTVVAGRAIVYGSLPPSARDIDLLVRPDEAAAIARRLRDDGFTPWNRTFVSFQGCTVLVVELIPAASLRLPANELDALFAEALPLGQLVRVAEPSPHHTLLILARRLRREPVLQPKYRDRIDRAVALDSAAWQRAEGRAGLWAAESALSRLRLLHNRGTDGRSRWRRRPARPRRTRLIVLAGADPDRTRSQADSLRESLDRLGFDALVEQPAAVPESRLAAIATALSLWRPIWRQVGRGRVLIYELSPLPSEPIQRGASVPARRRRRVLGLFSPTPLRSYVVDAQRPCARVCEELAEDAWRALVHRTPLEAKARRLLAGIRQTSTRLRTRWHRGPQGGGVCS
jgi:hypothetical protein